jgi:hypothetical protein
MSKQNLDIEEFEDKKTKAGKRYTRFKTDDGWMSCFDQKSCEELKQHEGETVSCEIAEANGFKNIRKYLGVANDDGEDGDDDAEEVKKPSHEPVKSNFNDFPISMKVSYAKDLIIAGKTPEEAVKTVKELIEGFTPQAPKIIRNFRKEIVKYLQTSDAGGVMEADLTIALEATKEEIDLSVKMLLDEGICFEPTAGKIKFLG